MISTPRVQTILVKDMLAHSFPQVLRLSKLKQTNRADFRGKVLIVRRFEFDLGHKSLKVRNIFQLILISRKSPAPPVVDNINNDCRKNEQKASPKSQNDSQHQIPHVQLCNFHLDLYLLSPNLHVLQAQDETLQLSVWFSPEDCEISAQTQASIANTIDFSYK